MKNTEKTMDKIVALCKNRGFVFPGSEIYGGLANTWDYGPLGAELKKNIKNAARKGGVFVDCAHAEKQASYRWKCLKTREPSHTWNCPKR